MEAVVNELKVVNGYDIYMKQLPPTKWYVGEILQEGANLLSGDPKVGKSFLALQIAIAVAGDATVVCGSLPVGVHGRVLYLALDDGSEKRLNERLHQLCSNTEALKNIDFVYERTLPTVLGGLDDLLDRYLSEHKYELVVLDTLGAVLGFVNSQQLYRTDYKEASILQRLAQKHGICLLIIHHTNKSESNDPVGRASGSHGLTGGVDSVLLLSSREKGVGRLVARPRDGEGSDVSLQRVDNGGWVVSSQSAPPVTRPLSEEQRETKEALANGPKSRDELAAMLDIEPEAARQRLRRMATKKMVFKTSDGRFEWIGQEALEVPSRVSGPSEASTVSGCPTTNP